MSASRSSAAAQIATRSTTPGAASKVATARVWRDFSQLAVEAFVVGIGFSIFVASAVVLIAREPRTDFPPSLDVTSVTVPLSTPLAVPASSVIPP